MFSLSPQGNFYQPKKVQIVNPEKKLALINRSFEDYAADQIVKSQNSDALSLMRYSDENALDIYKANGKRKKGPGSVNPMKGVVDPTSPELRYGYSARGIREKIARINFPILREAARKVSIISAIQNTRIQQLKPFSVISQSDDDPGFKIKLKEKDATPNKKQKDLATEIEQWFSYCGYKDFDGAEDREHHLSHVFQMLTRDMMTIDQIALSLRTDYSGKLLDFWVLDATTIKRTIPGMGYQGNTDIKFVQEFNGKVVEQFKKDELIFYAHNQRSDLLYYGYGWSYIEQCIDIITGWLFAMSYNKEVFNSSAMPKGFITFEGQQVDQVDLEELQRQWVTMFRGIKGMWRTPFLQHGAKWNTMAPSNQDMQWDKYTQVLASWVCAVHGIDAQEMGIRLNQAQNVLNENVENKVRYSADRGLKDLLSFHKTWMDLVIDHVPEWREYEIEFTGVEKRDQKAELDIDTAQIKSYMTINEKRKEKDLPPIEGGDVILDPTFMQNKQAEEMAAQQGAMGEGGDEGAPGGEPGFSDEHGLTPEEEESLLGASDDQLGQAMSGMRKSQDFIEVQI